MANSEKNTLENNLRIIALIFGVLLIGIWAYCNASYFGSYPYDGPFQTIYSLRKISSGTFPGRDFYFFHGNGIPYVHYPIYFIGGESIFSAMIAEEIVHVLALLVPLTYVIWKFCDIEIAIKSAILWIFLSSLSFFGYPLLGSMSIFQNISTFGIRTMMPLIVGYVVTIGMATNKFGKSDCLLIFLMPISFALGTEHGVYTIVLTFVFQIAKFFRGNNRYCFVLKSTFFVLLSLLWIFVFHLIVFGNLNAFNELKNLVGDQTWYYGVYPHLFIQDLGDVFAFSHPQLKMYRWYFLGSLVVIILLVYCKNRNLLSKKQIIFLAFIYIESLFGLLSNLGYVSTHYAGPLLRTNLLSMIFMYHSINQKLCKKIDSQS